MFFVKEKLSIKQKLKKKLKQFEIKYLKTRCFKEKTFNLIRIKKKPKMFV